MVGTELTQQRTQSCGCLIAEENKRRSHLWEEAYRYNVDKKDILRLHRIFNGMKERCYNLLSKDFPCYGAKGIKICNEWLLDINLFVKWSFENGYNKNLSIDRIDVYGNYEPNNCRWITIEEQARNKTTTVYVEYKGETRTLVSVLEENGIKNNYSTYRSRILKYGWDLDRTIKEPIRTNLKKEALNKLLNYFKEVNINKINIKEFCEKNNINCNTFRGYLSTPSFMSILNKNNIYKIEKGFLTYASDNENE